MALMGHAGWPHPETNYSTDVTVIPWMGIANGRPLVNLFRFKDKKYADKAVDFMVACCNNNKIRYGNGDTNYRGLTSNSDRNELKRELLRMPGGVTTENVKKISNVVHCDCSSLVTLCVYAATGVDLGDVYTASLASIYDSSGLFNSVKITDRIVQSGQGLKVGDIPLWRSSSGHTALVVDIDSSSYVEPEVITKDNLRSIIITPNKESVIISSRSTPNDQSNFLYGQTKSHSLNNSYGALGIKVFDSQSKEFKNVSRVVVTNNNGIPFEITKKTKYTPYAFIGDSRVTAMSSLDSNNLNYKKSYGFISNNQIFSLWGGTLQSIISGNYSTDAAKINPLQAYFWLGINDVQIYKDMFGIKHTSQGSTYYTPNTSYIKNWVNSYFNNLIMKYVRNHSNYKDFEKSKNFKVYIISIITTSDKEKDYYDGQNDIIEKVNLRLKQIVDDVYIAGRDDGIYTSQDDCWLQYIELDSQVGYKDFIDDIHFQKSWYISKFFPSINLEVFGSD